MFDKVPSRRPNTFVIDGSTAIIDLRGCRGQKVAETLIDTDDLFRVMTKKWCYDGHAYAVSTRPILTTLHGFIFKTDKLLDHINRNGLDNRRANLRFATIQQNMANRGPARNNQSGYKGVSYYKRRGKWQAIIGIDGKSRFLGYYPTAEAAAIRYDQEAVKLFGDFAYLNFQQKPQTDWEEAL